MPPAAVGGGIVSWSHTHVHRASAVQAECDNVGAFVVFKDANGTSAALSDTPEALVATLTEALEAVDRAWRASRGEVAP